MAIGVKIDPTVLIAGTVVQIKEQLEFLSDQERNQGKVPNLLRHNVMVLQESGATVEVRFMFDKHGKHIVPLPPLGQFYAVEARVSEGSFSRDGSEVQYVNLVALRPADNALDAIMSNFQAQAA